MAKSSMEDVAAAVRVVANLDKKGRLVILRDLLKQELEPKGGIAPKLKPGLPGTYKEGEE